MEADVDDAREQAAQMRRAAARLGRDSRVEQKQNRLASATFEDAFEAFFAIREQQLSYGQHVQQWRNTMRDYVLPKIGRRQGAGQPNDRRISRTWHRSPAGHTPCGAELARGSAVRSRTSKPGGDARYQARV